MLYVDSTFFQPSLVEDMHVAVGHEFVLLYEGRLHSTDDGQLDITLRGVVLHIIIITTKVVRITFILDDNVVEYNTCFYDHTQFSLARVSSKATVDGEVSL